VRRTPATSATLTYGVPPREGIPAGVIQYGTFVAAAGVCAGLGWVVARSGVLLGSLCAAGMAIAAVVALSSVADTLAGTFWRRHGRALRGVAFFLDEQSPAVRLNRRMRVRYRPLSQLRAVEVRYSRGHIDMYRPEEKPTESAWLRLCFRNAPGGRASWYYISPYYLNHFTVDHRGFAAPGLLARQLRRLLESHGVAVRDERASQAGVSSWNAGA